jgi:hypothetical protein
MHEFGDFFLNFHGKLVFMAKYKHICIFVVVKPL